MDTQNKEGLRPQSENLSSSGAEAPVAAATAATAVPSAGVAEPLASSSVSSGAGVADPLYPVCSPDLWEVTAREWRDWEFSCDGLRTVRRVNLGELLALLGVEVVSDHCQCGDALVGASSIESVGELKAAKKLRLGVWDNMRRRWDAVVDNDLIFTVRLELDYNDEAGFFSVCVPGIVEGYELKLEPAFRKKGGAR